LVQDTFRALFSHCLLALEKGPALKIQNALQTLHCLLYALCRKKYNDFASEIVNLMCGIDYAETFFNRMFRAILEILSVKCSGSCLAVSIFSLCLLFNFSNLNILVLQSSQIAIGLSAVADCVVLSIDLVSSQCVYGLSRAIQ
jgi:hypothetical protein